MRRDWAHLTLAIDAAVRARLGHMSDPHCSGCGVEMFDDFDRPRYLEDCAHCLDRRRKHATLGASKPRVERFCSVEGCERKHRALNYCNTHLQRFRKHGHPGGVEIKTQKRVRANAVVVWND